MKLLLDTHILLWTAIGNLPSTAKKYIADTENTLYFSPASIWELVIKQSLGREDFSVDPQALYLGLLDAGYIEIAINAQHTLLISSLSQIHKDPFDRLLLAQAAVEGLTFFTADKKLRQYGGSTIIV